MEITFFTTRGRDVPKTEVGFSVLLDTDTLNCWFYLRLVLGMAFGWV